jgi:phosphate transport system permease protein
MTQSSSTNKVHSSKSFFSHLLNHGDRLWNVLMIAAAVLILILIVSVGLQLWSQSDLSRQKLGFNFIIPQTSSSWDPVNGNFNSWTFVYGTLVTSLAAIILALPVGLMVAIFMAELCPSWLRLPINLLVEMLAAIPSVIYGLWGIFVFLPEVVTPIGNFLQTVLGSQALFAGPIPISGASRLAASLLLAIMILPTITAVSRDVFLAIPNSQREASLALGATQWETIQKVLIPYGLSGILGAAILGLGRALGETMAVTMVIGNSIEGSLSLLRPGYTMSSVIANEFAEAVNPLHTSVLIEIALILFVLTLLLNTMARLLVWSISRKTPKEARS